MEQNNMTQPQEEKKSKKKRAILLLFMLLLVQAVIGGTYARYLSQGEATGESAVAKWAIKLNTQDITAAGNTTFNVDFKEVANNFVVDGKVAPGSDLYADFIIDPTGTEVAVDYEFELGAITASTAGQTLPTDLKVKEVKTLTKDGGGEFTVEGSALTKDANNKYTGTINLVPATGNQTTALTANESVAVRVYITWPNDEAKNAADTAVGKVAPAFSMAVSGTVKQHIGA